MAQREKGTVKWFNPKKGYGFIARNDGNDVFVHSSSLQGNGYRTLEEGDQVEFEVASSEKGLEAKEVKLLN